MRSAQLNTGSGNSRRRRADRAARGGAPREARLRGLRWVPVPLAILAAVAGLLVVGALQGQAAAQRARDGYQAAGLALSVGTMAWMSNDMTGQGPVKGVANGYSMAPGMMPGMQSGNNNRLRVEVSLRNVTSDVQRYSLGDFSVAAPGGQSWRVNNNGRSDTPTSADLEPGFGVTVDLYFDVPAAKSHHLILKWSPDGSTVSIPVSTGNSQPGKMRM